MTRVYLARSYTVQLREKISEEQVSTVGRFEELHGSPGGCFSSKSSCKGESKRNLFCRDRIHNDVREEIYPESTKTGLRRVQDRKARV